MSKLAHIADRVLNRPLMIHPDKLGLIASILDGRIGIDAADLRAREISIEEAGAMMGNGPDASRYVGQYALNDPNDPKSGRKPYRTTAEGIAIIPVLGSLVNRGSWLDAMSGVSSYERLKFQIGAAAADSDVTSILLDMDSPGGEAVGAFEAGDAVAAAARVKDVVAVVNGMAASAAYAIASQATRIVTTSSGISGSIGVVMLHADYSVAIANRGIKPTLIHAGARKVDGNPYQPLTDDVKAELKAEIDRFYDLFVSSVAKGRAGLTEKAIRATEARTYIGAHAVKIGLADSVGSFEAVVDELSAKRSRSGTTSKLKGISTMSAQESLVAAVNEGRRVERLRIASILGSAEAAGRLNLAITLATTTDRPVDQVLAELRSSGSSQSDVTAMWDKVMTDKGLLNGPNAASSPASVSSMWDQSLASRGLKSR